MDWRRVDLDDSPPEDLGGRFAPIAKVTAYGPDSVNVGTGFLVNPNVLLTAAHVVLFFDDDGPLVGGRIALEFGHARFFADRVVLPFEFLDHPSVASDVAVLRIRDPVCEASDVLRMAPTANQGQKFESTIWGRWTGDLEPVDVGAKLDGSILQYVCSNLPGHSGAPLVVPRASAAELPGSRFLGIHSRFTAGSGRGNPISRHELQLAFQRLTSSGS